MDMSCSQKDQQNQMGLCAREDYRHMLGWPGFDRHLWTGKGPGRRRL